MSDAPRPEISLRPSEGWHCSHLFYQIDRARLRSLSHAELGDGLAHFESALDAQGPEAPARLQTFVVSGGKADFGFLAMDPDPLVVDSVHQRLMACPLGPALTPAWSFVSLTEISEYLPSVEEFGRRLEREGADPAGEAYREKLAGYTRRLEIMRRQRLTPDLPVWPALCFYPMNKRRDPQANWFLLPFDERDRLMREHGESGMLFSGKVTQLVTVGIGLDDWEWGVTLWARNPQFLKDIVYRMRFDEASARYAEFGPFYVGYLRTPHEIVEHLRLA